MYTRVGGGGAEGKSCYILGRWIIFGRGVLVQVYDFVLSAPSLLAGVIRSKRSIDVGCCSGTDKGYKCTNDGSHTPLFLCFSAMKRDDI